MTRRGGWKAPFGTVLSMTMLFGCFAPVIYGAYKVYDIGKHQVIVLRIMDNPETVYRTSMLTAGERDFKIDTRDDKQMVYSGKNATGLDTTVKVSALPQGGALLSVTLEKGKDPKAEREGIVNAVLDVCSKLGTRCTEEKEK